MTRHTTAFILGLAALAGGCTVTPHHHDVRVYPDDRRVVYQDDAYEGYYYVRIVYLGGVPWYVDEDLRARPVPAHLRSHFRYGAWAHSAPPSFGRDTGMRDGYRLSRIVYIEGVPHHVDDGRHARPIPTRLRSRFSYDSVARHDDNGRGPGQRSAPPGHMREEARPLPPAAAREREEPSTFGRGNALGRVTERVREEARPLPPEAGRERQEPRTHEAANESRRGMREETGHQDPPFARNGRGVPPSQPEGSSARDESRERRGQPSAREAQRMTPASAGQPAHEVAPRERVAAQSAADARRAGTEPERKNRKGKGRDDDEETDYPDERDGEAGKRNKRDE
jgi:hypothetical protein